VRGFSDAVERLRRWCFGLEELEALAVGAIGEGNVVVAVVEEGMILGPVGEESA
jgi:hypothetical protein